MPTGLLERHDQIEALLAAVADAAAGRGCVVLVTGESGIGKTSLIRASLSRLGPEVRVLRGACDDLLAPRALGPLRDAARDSAGPLARAVDSSIEEVFGAVVAALSGGPPTVLVIEDVHWADDATLDVLRYLARRIAGLPAVVVLSFRDDAVVAGHPVQQLLGALAGTNTVRLKLEPLSPEAVGELARPTGRPGPAVYEVTGGNPFFVTETLAAPPDALPASVADAVRARLRWLGPGCLAALEQLCVVPTVVEFGLAEALLGDELGELAEAEERGIIQVRAAGLAFRHELARRSVESGLSQLRRRALNQAVVRSLIASDDSDPARLVHHAVQAADAGTIISHAPRAAREAVEAGSHRQALAHFEAALPHAGRLRPNERAQLLDGYAWELYNAHRFTEAVTFGRDIVGRYERLGEPVALGETLLRLSRYVFMSGDTDEAERAIERAVGVLQTAGSVPALAAATTERGAMLTLTGQPEVAVTALRHARQLAVDAGRPDLESLSLNYLGLARVDRGERDGEADMRAALATAVANGCHEAAARAYVNLGEFLNSAGRWTDLAECVDAGLLFAEDHGMGQHNYMMQVQSQALRLHHGDWDAAEQGLRALIELRPDRSMIDVFSLPMYGRLLARRGRPEAGELLERAWGRAIRQRTPLGLAHAGRALVEWAWLGEQPDRAREVGEVLLPRMWSIGWSYLRGEVLRYLARAGLPAEPFDRCPEGYAAGLRGDWRAAADAWERAGDPYERALELAESGEVGPTLDALSVLDELGAVAPAALVRVRLRELGVTRLPRGPRPATRANPAGLTDRQLDVLDLVAEGATNVEIAERLVLSVRTVDHHVAAILAKFGARSRREAVAAARSLPPSAPA